MEERRRKLVRWVDRFGPRLLRVARSMTDSEDEAMDVMQEAWMVVLDYEKPIPPEEEAGAWLHVIVVNIAKYRMVKEKRRSGLVVENPEMVPEPSRLEQPALEVSLLYREVSRFIAEMGSLQRRVLLLRIVDGLSTIETARAVGRTEGTVKSSLSRAVASLRARFGGDVKDALASISSRDGPADAPPERRRSKIRRKESVDTNEESEQ